MLVAANNTYIGAARTVQHRGKVHLKPPIAAGEFPRAHKVVLAVLLRDQEGQLLQLVRRAIVEQHILAGGTGIAKAIPDIKAKGSALHCAVAAAPVPGVFVGPYAAAPVQGGIAFLGVKFDHLPVKFHLAGSLHAVDLLVVVKGLFVLRKGRHDHHGILRLFRQGKFRRDRLFIHKILHPGRQLPGTVRQHLKAEISVFALHRHISLGAAGRETGLSARERIDDIAGVFPRLTKIQQREAQQSHVAVVVYGQRHTPPSVHDEVVVPFLDAVGRRLDRPAVVCLDETAGIARFAQLALFVQQRAGVGQFFLHGVPPSFCHQF